MSKATARGFLIVNPRSGDESPTPAELLARARGLDVDAHVLEEGEDLQAVAEAAVREGASALGMAGGDGSLGCVAGVAAAHERPFVCIPFGTRNHFARDLGIDRDDPLGALAAFRGDERRVDLGFVSGQPFVNNVSLGLYASFVRDAERRTRNRLGALVRMAPAAVGRSREPLDVSFEVDGRREAHRALVVLVANNDYRMESMADVGERTRLDEGRLHAYVIGAVSRRALVGLLLRAATGADLAGGEGWVEWSAERFRIDSSHPRLHAAVDGDPAVFEAPLDFEIRARALRVLIPRR